MTRALERRVHVPLQAAQLRRVHFALEVLDAVTLSRIGAGIGVSVDGLNHKPIRNASDILVWTLPRVGGALPVPVPVMVRVDPMRLPYQPASMAVPLIKVGQPPLLSLSLSPGRDYPFAAGVAGIRATLVQDVRADPLQPLAQAPVSLQWLDPAVTAPTWIDSPVRSVTDDNGDFAAIARVAVSQSATLDAQGLMRLRLAATYETSTRYSAEFVIPQGRVVNLTDLADPKKPAFGWNAFTP